MLKRKDDPCPAGRRGHVFVWGASSSLPIPAYLYGMSLRFDWLWECGTRGAEATSRTPQTASSWALPDRLRSLPLRLPPLPPPLICCRVLDVGVEVEETFFLAWPPKTKNLQRTTSAESRVAKRYEGLRCKPYLFFCRGCPPLAAKRLRYWSERINLG